MTHSETVANTLRESLDEAARKLKTISSEQAAHKTSDITWSAKEILGHLLDSAVNNHLRFIRVQQESNLVLQSYEQTFWVSSQRYNEKGWTELIDLWHLYNRHLAQVISYIPASNLDTPCTIHTTEASESATLGFIVEDYISHMQHHLKQIYERSDVDLTMKSP